MSLVEVSLSTVILLNVFSLTLVNNPFKITGDKSASVKIYPNIVAILGAIIPDPFDTPIIFTFLFPILLIV